jgi:hypothetical protein
MLNTRALGWLSFGICVGSAACAAVSSNPGARVVADGTSRVPSSDPHSLETCDAGALDCCPRDGAGRVTLCQLFAQLIDLRHLTRMPNPAYTSQMVSSFDRASLSARPGEEAWLANRDFAELTPGEPFQLLDVDGPGVLTRIWSANPSGTLRIYLDRSPRPVIEAPMRDLLRGKVQPWGEPFGYEAASGSNLYLPIPYQSHCSVTVTSTARKLFYQVSYRRYANDVRIEPFSVDALSDPKRVPAVVRRVLSGVPPSSRSPTAQIERYTLATSGAPEHSVAAAAGGSLLRELQVRVPDPSPAALRQTLLRIRVDGADTVRVPFGDFFGSGPGLQTVNALPLQVEPASGTFIARWPMPFRSELRIALEQGDGVPMAAEVTLVHEPRAFEDDTLLFRAHWRAPEWHSSEPSHEFTLTELQGTGLYVGTVLNVTNTDAGWWGEGDEKIWIDGERFPSFFGTGTEDYFGYGWCSNKLFSRAYVGQTRADQRANFGRVSLYRFHVFDPIAFDRELRFDLEVNHWGSTPTPIEYDSVVYYYARPGTTAKPAAEDQALYRIPELDVPAPEDVKAGPYRCGGDG